MLGKLFTFSLPPLKFSQKYLGKKNPLLTRGLLLFFCTLRQNLSILPRCFGILAPRGGCKCNNRQVLELYTEFLLHQISSRASSLLQCLRMMDIHLCQKIGHKMYLFIYLQYWIRTCENQTYNAAFAWDRMDHQIQDRAGNSRLQRKQKNIYSG